jgi:hypothetical protein
MPKEVDAITKLHDFIFWMVSKMERFPRNQKFPLASRIETHMPDILDDLIEAAYSQKKDAVHAVVGQSQDREAGIQM